MKKRTKHSHSKDVISRKNDSKISVTESSNNNKLKFNWMYAVYVAIILILIVSFMKTSYAASSGSGCGDSCGSCGSCGCGDDKSEDDDDDGSNNNENRNGANNPGDPGSGVTTQPAPTCTRDITLSMTQSNDFTEYTFIVIPCTETTFDIWLVRDPEDGRNNKNIYQQRVITENQRMSATGREFRTANYVQICYKTPNSAECCTSGGSVSC